MIKKNQEDFIRGELEMHFYWLPEKTPSALIPGLKALAEEYPVHTGTQEGIELMFEELPSDSEVNNHVTLANGQARVAYKSPTDAFRALGRLMGEITEGRSEMEFQEKANFETLTAMIDCSRNGVMKIDHLKYWLRRMALMGFNGLTLYTEDTYEVPGEPYFGYLRGRYTTAELRELDRYASALGIEVFPCIQTLAHLEQILNWDVYKNLQDTPDILLVGEEKTYELLEKMITAASKPFRSKRIHIGMDEAHGLGTGHYKEKHGERSAFDIMNEHLHRVVEICKRHGLHPMIWSDMYFRLGSKTGDYYDRDSVIPQNVIHQIPEEVSLVYWDYYHTDYDFYAEWIERHRVLKRDLVVAPAAWTWNRFWTLLPYTFATIEPCLQACKDAQVKEILLTLWGDDGAECDFDSSLPALQFCAEHRYSADVDPDLLRRNFRAICGEDFDLCVKASELDAVPGLVNPQQDAVNLSKWLLWDDPLLGTWRNQLSDSPVPWKETGGISELEKHYADLFQVLFEVAKQPTPGVVSHLTGPGKMSQSFGHAAQLARVLSLKHNLREKLVTAYHRKDLAKLRKYLREEIPSLKSEVEKLWRSHRALWMRDRKPFGWEVLELRYGGLMARLDTLRERIEMFVQGEYKSIPEFDTQPMPPYPKSMKSLPVLGYRQIVTPSTVI